MIETTSLLASPQRTPNLAAHYQKLSQNLKANLWQGRYIRSQIFAPCAQILLTTRCNGASVQPYDSFNVAHHVGDELNQVQANRRLVLEDTGCQHICFMEQTHSKRVCVVQSSSLDGILATPSHQNLSDAACLSEHSKVLPPQTEHLQANAALLQPNTVQSSTVDQPNIVQSVVQSESMHNADIIKISDPIVPALDCDGLVTAERGIALAVMTADCLPLLLCDVQEHVIAAIHCGWKGIERGIIQEALNKMQTLGAQTSHIQAFMGAAIGDQSFEVGTEVKDTFIKQHKDFAAAFIQEQDFVSGKLKNITGKYLCDLYELCRIVLQQAGVSREHISGGEFDTRMQTDVFYSYRASKVTGRLASIIWMP